MNKKKKVILGGSIGNCVHVAGVFEYLRIAENVGYKTRFLGPAVAPHAFAQDVKKNCPGIVCISYRLTPSGLSAILKDFFSGLETIKIDEMPLFYFGGTPECVKVARSFPQFSFFFIGEENYSYILKSLFINESQDLFHGNHHKRALLEGRDLTFEDLRDAINNRKYMPLIRHHFGLPTLEETIDGVRKIAEAEVLDVISIAPDQNAQQFFFEPKEMDPALDGAGGVPLRREKDLIKIYEASQTGNFPRLRIYAGTSNLLKWAEMSTRLIHNAWGTIPLFWYSELDGRSKRTVEAAVKENQEVIRWYGSRNIPVEINDAHQWSLRDGSDVMAAVDFYIAAYNAKKLGVKKYIAQLMFNTPRLTSPKMDLAKMMAKIELIKELEDEHFLFLKQVRAGLTHFSIDIDVAKGQLAASTLLSLALSPHIIHVVSFSEATHAATADDVIESCKIVKGVIRNTLLNFPDLTIDPEVLERKNKILEEANRIIGIIQDEFSSSSIDPLTDPVTLAKIVKLGILDAPHLKGNSAALGTVRTIPVNGAYKQVDTKGNLIKESDYITRILGKSI